MTSTAMLHHIASIINHDDPKELIAKQLARFKPKDWENFVQMGSTHLILPALYCKLQQKDVLSLLPKDLEQYLKELSAINRNRNKRLLQQSQNISNLLQAHGVEHAFLKGIALLIKGCYKDIAERMIGDIDILVAPKQLGRASQLLREKGYTYKTESFGSKYLPYHQDIRLLPEANGLAAVELHRYPLHRGYEHIFTTTDILNQKEKSNDFFIPNLPDLITHVVLNHEINDHGYLNATIHLRSAYDYLCLIQNHSTVNPKISARTQFYHSFFIYKTSYYFSMDKAYSNLPDPSALKMYTFKVQQNPQSLSKKLFKASLKCIHFWNDVIVGILWTRLKLLCFNSNYRKDLWKDRRRIIRLIYTKFN